MSDISSSVPSPHDMHAVNRANAAAVTLSTPSSTQATVSTITTAPSGVSVMIDFTGGGGGDGDESGGEEAGMDEEQLQPLRSVVDCAYIKARTVNDGKDGWECVWCGKICAPRHVSRARWHVLKIKNSDITICKAIIPDRFHVKYLALFNSSQVWLASGKRPSKTIEESMVPQQSRIYHRRRVVELRWVVQLSSIHLSFIIPVNWQRLLVTTVTD
jgi:hypothetical protein